MPLSPASPLPERLSPEQTTAIRNLCEKMGIELLILFGSFVTGGMHPRSDMDVAVQMPKGATAPKLELIFELGGIFEPLDIDLVVLGPETDPLLLHEIFFKGILIYEREKDLFQMGKLRAWKLYLDTAPLRRQREEYFRNYRKNLALKLRLQSNKTLSVNLPAPTRMKASFCPLK